jgi:hypothetical protein
MVRLLTLVGLFCDLAGAIVLAAGLLGFKRIERFRHYLGQRTSEKVVMALRRINNILAKELPHTMGPPGCVIFVLLVFVSIPVFAFFLLMILASKHILSWSASLRVVLAYLLTGAASFLLTVKTDGWKSARREFLSVTLGWPVFGVLPPLALLRLLADRFLELSLGGWVQVTKKISALQEDRFVGLLGLSIIVVGFLFQAVALFMDT